MDRIKLAPKRKRPRRVARKIAGRLGCAHHRDVDARTFQMTGQAMDEVIRLIDPGMRAAMSNMASAFQSWIIPSPGFGGAMPHGPQAFVLKVD